MNYKYFPAPDEVVRIAGKQNLFQSVAEYGLEVWSAEQVKRLKETIDKDIDGYIKSKDESSSVNGIGRKTCSKDNVKDNLK